MGVVAEAAGPDAAGRETAPASGRRRRWIGVVVAAGVLVGVVVMVFPDLLFGLDRFTPFAQLVWLRPYLLVTVAVLVPVLAGFAWRYRRMRTVLVGLVVGLVVVVAAGAVMVVPRTIATPVPPGGRVLTVVAFNTRGGAADVGEVAALIRTEQPDVVALVEAGESYRSRLALLVEPFGYRLFTAIGNGDGEIGGVTAVVADRLGDVRAVAYATSAFPSVQLEGGALGRLRFVAFHSLAPRRGDVPKWRSDLEDIARWCSGRSPAIIAGDFNATLDHSVLRTAMSGCSDAAAQRGHGLTPTWPTWLPDWLGPQIDHVIATAPIVAESFAVREITGSDHRAVIARLRV